jgi:hypothetical protein
VACKHAMPRSGGSSSVRPWRRRQCQQQSRWWPGGAQLPRCGKGEQGGRAGQRGAWRDDRSAGQRRRVEEEQRRLWLCSCSTSMTTRARQSERDEGDRGRGSGYPHQRAWQRVDTRWRSCRRARGPRGVARLCVVGHDLLQFKITMELTIPPRKFD